MKPVNKAHELALRSEDVLIGYEADMMNMIYILMKECRMIDRGRDKKQQVMDFHRRFVLENDKFPDDVYYTDVYPAFITYAENKIPKPSTVLGMKLLFEDWYKPPEPKGKAEPPPLDDRQPPVNLNVRTEELPPAELTRQFKIIMTIYKPEQIKHLMTMPRTHTARIVNEMDRRGLIEKVKDEV